MDLSLWIMLGLTKLLSWILNPIFWLVSKGNQKKVPPIKDQLLFISATELSRQIRSRKIKSETIVKAYIARIKEVNPIVNAVVEDRFVDAIAEAKAVDDYLNSNVIDENDLEISKPLLGVPFTVKESCCLKGMSFSVGSKTRLGIKASEDGACTKLIRNSGAIPLLVSNTPEFCLYWESNNLITGRTNNPYNTSRSSAGSSGGEGALLGSGASLMGIGTDIAGSIRLPALFNGIFGHKGTANAVNFEGHFPSAVNEKMKFYGAMGPMVRYAEDLELLYKVMVGGLSPKLQLDDPIDLTSINVFHMHETTKSIVFTSVDLEIKSLIDKTVQHLQTKGSKLNNQKFNLDKATEIVTCIFYSIPDIPNILHDPMKGKEVDDAATEFFKSILGLSNYTKHGIYFTLIKNFNGFVPKNKLGEYEKELEMMKMNFLNALKDNGVFIFPTFPIPAYRHNEFIIKLNGITYLGLFNIFGFPCTHVPMGLNKNGLPIGIQVVAGPYQDRLCFAVAKELEKAFGGWVSPS